MKDIARNELADQRHQPHPVDAVETVVLTGDPKGNVITGPAIVTKEKS